jgi:hypothetical protein
MMHKPKARALAHHVHGPPRRRIAEGGEPQPVYPNRAG